MIFLGVEKTLKSTNVNLLGLESSTSRIMVKVINTMTIHFVLKV